MQSHAKSSFDHLIKALLQFEIYLPLLSGLLASGDKQWTIVNCRNWNLDKFFFRSDENFKKLMIKCQFRTNFLKKLFSIATTAFFFQFFSSFQLNVKRCSIDNTAILLADMAYYNKAYLNSEKNLNKSQFHLMSTF